MGMRFWRPALGPVMRLFHRFSGSVEAGLATGFAVAIGAGCAFAGGMVAGWFDASAPLTGLVGFGTGVAAFIALAFAMLDTYEGLYP